MLPDGSGVRARARTRSTGPGRSPGSWLQTIAEVVVRACGLRSADHMFSRLLLRVRRGRAGAGCGVSRGRVVLAAGVAVVGRVLAAGLAVVGRVLAAAAALE